MCPIACTCGKHHQHRRTYNLLTGRTLGPLEPGHAEQQRARIERATAERQAAGIAWRDRPSERFNYEAAITRLYKVFADVYGPDWRSAQ
jgi:hypothetical protein